MAELVVLPFFVRIAQGFIGGRNFLEFLLGFLVARILVRMVFDRKFAVCFLNFIGGGSALHSENLVIILCHECLFLLLRLCGLRFGRGAGGNHYPGGAQQFVAHFEAARPLLENLPLGDGVGGFAGDGLVQFGIELRADRIQFFHIQFIECLVEFGDDHIQSLPDRLDVVGFFRSGFGHIQIVEHGQERRQRIGGAVNPRIRNILGDPLAVILIVRLQVDQLFLEIVDLFFSVSISLGMDSA